MGHLIEIPISIAVLACDARVMAIWDVTAGKAAALMSRGNGPVVNRVGSTTGSNTLGVPGSGVPLFVPLLPALFIPFVTAIMRIAATIIISRLGKHLVRLVSLFDGVILPSIVGQE